MSDLRLNETTWDIELVDGDLNLLTGKEAIRQNIRQRLQLFKGEWFLDTAAGVPYYQDVFKKNPNPKVVEALFQDAIFNTPGVEELLNFNLLYDGAARNLRLEFAVRTADGDINLSEVVEV